MSVGESLLSKVIDDNAVSTLTRFTVERDHFATEAERGAYQFIRDYAEMNRGQAPSYATFVAENPDITYIPQVSDSYEYLIRKLKDSAGKRRIAEFVNKELAPLYASHDTETLISILQSRLEDIKMGTHIRKTVGTDIKTDTDAFLEEYRKRKEGRSFRIWRSKFPSVNTAIGGGYYGANMYTIFARSGRGKSIITMEEALEFTYQGATVLIWALEMGAFEWMARAYTSISAREGIVTAQINGVDYDAGFDNRALQSGKLSDDYEAGLVTFMSTLNDTIPGRIILRAVDDEDFRDRSLRQLEADIIETNADIVVIDPFYYLDYEPNTSKTTGGDAANTSRKLRQILGRTGVTGIVVTQADEDAKEKGDDGIREMRPPKRAEVKKTKALLEDATNVIAIDTLAHEGRGMIEIGKGRNGGEDARIEVIYLPNYGIVRELEAGEALAAQFSDAF
jgi:replicative DNA helicase